MALPSFRMRKRLTHDATAPFLTFTGSLMAMSKLQEILPSRPIT